MPPWLFAVVRYEVSTVTRYRLCDSWNDVIESLFISFSPGFNRVISGLSVFLTVSTVLDSPVGR